MFKILLDMPVPDYLQSDTEDPLIIAERDKHIIWKIKSQAARVTYRLFSKYANPKYVMVSDEADKAWI